MTEPRTNFFDCIQGSPEWLKLRCGCVTSSQVSRAIAFLKRKSNGKDIGAETQSRADYKLELIAERLTGNATDHYVSRWMKEGKEKEPLARATYEIETGCMADPIGFILHPEIDFAGCSPDSLVGDDGLAEYKCPMARTHLEYLVAGRVPELYEPQMLWQMACDPERKWNDFVSYCPEMPKKYRTFIKRLPRDDKRIAEMEVQVKTFLAEVAEMLERLQFGEDYTAHKLRQSIALIADNSEPDYDLEIAEEDCRA